ncbi:MAG: zinc ribbon domain-containing protein [archaeon]
MHNRKIKTAIFKDIHKSVFEAYSELKAGKLYAKDEVQLRHTFVKLLSENLADEELVLEVANEYAGAPQNAQEMQKEAKHSFNELTQILAKNDIVVGSLGKQFRGPMDASDVKYRLYINASPFHIQDLAVEILKLARLDTCPRCHSPSIDNANICPECGESFENVNKCPKCKEKISPTANICPSCGFKLNSVRWLKFPYEYHNPKLYEKMRNEYIAAIRDSAQHVKAVLRKEGDGSDTLIELSNGAPYPLETLKSFLESNHLNGIPYVDENWVLRDFVPEKKLLVAKLQEMMQSNKIVIYFDDNKKYIKFCVSFLKKLPKEWFGKGVSRFTKQIHPGIGFSRQPDRGEGKEIAESVGMYFRRKLPSLIWMAVSDGQGNLLDQTEKDLEKISKKIYWELSEFAEKIHSLD